MKCSMKASRCGDLGAGSGSRNAAAICSACSLNRAVLVSRAADGAAGEVIEVQRAGLGVAVLDGQPGEARRGR